MGKCGNWWESVDIIWVFILNPINGNNKSQKACG